MVRHHHPFALAACALAFAALSACSSPQPEASPSPSGNPSPTTGVYSPNTGDLDAVVEMLRHTVNYSGLEHSPNEGSWDKPLSAAGFKAIADAGFTAVRLPIRFSAHQQLTPPYTIDEAFLERVDWAIDQALSNGLAVIVDNHHWGVVGQSDFDAIFIDPESQKPRLDAIWEQVSTRYADQPAGVVFEIQGEPHLALDAYWNEYQADEVAIIRESNSDRAVIVTGGHWSNAWALNDLVIPDDPNLIVTFHDYLPMDFTHQGAEWLDPIPPIGVEWPMPTLRVSSNWEDWSWGSIRTLTARGWDIQATSEWSGIALHGLAGIDGATDISITTDGAADLWVDCTTAVAAATPPIQITTAPGVATTIPVESCGLTDSQLVDLRMLTGPNPNAHVLFTAVDVTTATGTTSLIITPVEETLEPLDYAAAWSDAHGGVPMFMGEFGASNFADQASRENWVRTMREGAEERGILWSYWDTVGLWGFWRPDTGLKNQWLIDALLDE